MLKSLLKATVGAVLLPVAAVVDIGTTMTGNGGGLTKIVAASVVVNVAQAIVPEGK